MLHVRHDLLPPAVSRRVLDSLDVVSYHLVGLAQAEHLQDAMDCVEDLIAAPELCPCPLEICKILKQSDLLAPISASIPML
jgi:hypothetical protein